VCARCQREECVHTDAAYLLGPWSFLDDLDGRPPDPPLAPWLLLSDWRRRRLLA
jgi:hypothetical protein